MRDHDFRSDHPVLEHCDRLLGSTEALPILDAIERTQARWRGRPELLELQNEHAIAYAVQVAGPQEQLGEARNLPYADATRPNPRHARLGSRQPVEPRGGVRDPQVGR